MIEADSQQPEKILVTGGCGFIGSNFIKYLHSLESSFFVINIDSLTYAGNARNIEDYLKRDNFIFEKGSINDNNFLTKIFDKYKPDYVVNFAAESHVDRSINDPSIFFRTNVGGTLNLLNHSLENEIKRFLQVSTDEVYGSLDSDGYFTEETNINPNSPYSASKASADFFVRSYFKTYGLETIITRCSNNYGPYQFPEKLIPVVISNAMNDVKIPVYGKGDNVRDWIHVSDHCEGIYQALMKGVSGEVYNFGGDAEISNLNLVLKILKELNKTENLIEHVEDRLGHDFRYAIDFSKSSKQLNWYPKVKFDDGLKDTIYWYKENQNWLDSILSGNYRIFNNNLE